MTDVSVAPYWMGHKPVDGCPAYNTTAAVCHCNRYRTEGGED
jgi:hypothetical protein